MGHALDIAKHLFLSAIRHNEEVRIVTGGLFDEFYRELIKDARKVLNHVRISIIVVSKTREELEGNGFFAVVDAHKNGKVVFLPKGTPNMNHFILVGKSRYRIEIDDSKTTAFACFNDEGFGAHLSHIFDNREIEGAAA